MLTCSIQSSDPTSNVQSVSDGTAVSIKIFLFSKTSTLWGPTELASRILLASCQQNCMTYNIAVCTVKNSWWWTEEMSKTCRVLFQK